MKKHKPKSLTKAEIDRHHEEILSANYWENFKYSKELSESLGANHPKAAQQREATNQIRSEWDKLKEDAQENTTES